METLLVCLLVSYGVWLAAYLFWEKRQTGKSLPDAAATPAEKPHPAAGHRREKHLSDKAENAKHCHSDATSCHETGKRKTDGKCGYICP